MGPETFTEANKDNEGFIGFLIFISVFRAVSHGRGMKIRATFVHIRAGSETAGKNRVLLDCECLKVSCFNACCFHFLFGASALGLVVEQMEEEFRGKTVTSLRSGTI